MLGVSWSGGWAKATLRVRGPSLGRRQTAPGCRREHLGVGEGSWGKVEFSVGFSLCLEDYQNRLEEAPSSRAGYSPLRGNAGGASAGPGLLLRRRELPPVRAAASRPGGAARWIVGWGLRRPHCGLGHCLPGPSRAEAGGRSEGNQWSREQKRQSSGRGAAAAAAAPLEAGDVGEAVAGAAEAALRTRGKLLADRTPGRDVRELPLPPLTPERSWAREGGPVLPQPTSQPARGGGGKPGSGPAGLRAAAAAEQQPRCDVEGWRRRRCTRPRSGAAARDPQVGVGPAARGPQRFAAHPHPDLLQREDRDPTPSVSSPAGAGRVSVTTDQRRSFHSSRPPPPPLPSYSPSGIGAGSCAPRFQPAAATPFSPLSPLGDPGCGTATTRLRRCPQTFPFFFQPGPYPFLILLE